MKTRFLIIGIIIAVGISITSISLAYNQEIKLARESESFSIVEELKSS